mgnify:CR=1 FL=1
MVAKLLENAIPPLFSLNLAKIHMVAKRGPHKPNNFESLNLAKIHMVAKQLCVINTSA